VAAWTSRLEQRHKDRRVEDLSWRSARANLHPALKRLQDELPVVALFADVPEEVFPIGVVSADPLQAPLYDTLEVVGVESPLWFLTTTDSWI
jgi:hypothetical protein